jgi:hypothetical protein
MTAARLRSITGGASALAVFVLSTAPLARLGAQAATITAPKAAAQRAAAASNRRLEAQMSQAQGRPAPASPQRSQSSPRQGARTPPGVVQSGTPAATAGAATTAAPDPRARAAGGAATPAPDPPNAIMREVFQYNIQGRRDPFFSLMSTGDLRPMLSDLRLTTILYDLSGRRPVAVMNDVSTGQQHRVTTGMMLGRMRVTRITPRKVYFAIEEFGFSRADSLVLADKPHTRK